MSNRDRRRWARHGAVMGGALFLAASLAAAEAPIPKSPFMAYVGRYTDAMADRGRDAAGPQKTGLFLGALNRTTLAPLDARPRAPAGLREEDRVGPPGGPLAGANLQHDENLLRLYYVRANLAGKPGPDNPDYSKPPDAALKWFFENAAAGPPGLLPWGAGRSWDVMKDVPSGGADAKTVAFFGPWTLWDRCYEVAPEATQKVARALLAAAPPDSPRQAGFFIRAWAAAYARTKDEAFARAIESQLDRAESKRHPKTGLLSAGAAEEKVVDPAQSLSMAIDCAAAAANAPSALASRLRAFAAREDEAFCALAHDLKGKGGFVAYADWAAGTPLPRANEGFTPVWNPADGGLTTARMGLMCVSRYENGGGSRYRPLIVAAADAYLNSFPGEEIDVWPGTYGEAISLELGAWRATSRAAYFDRANALAQRAVDTLWGDAPLPRASAKSDHYEAATGAGTLVMSFLELHLYTLGITAVRCPANTIDR